MISPRESYMTQRKIDFDNKIVYRDEKKFRDLMELTKDPLILPPHYVRPNYQQKFFDKKGDVLNLIRTC